MWEKVCELGFWGVPLQLIGNVFEKFQAPFAKALDTGSNFAMATLLYFYREGTLRPFSLLG